MRAMVFGWSSLYDVWGLLRRRFAADAPKGEGSPHSDAQSPAVARQAVDVAARNALLEIHFRDMKDRRRAIRRFAGARSG
jgi:hypothetical protein